MSDLYTLFSVLVLVFIFLYMSILANAQERDRRIEEAYRNKRNEDEKIKSMRIRSGNKK